MYFVDEAIPVFKTKNRDCFANARNDKLVQKTFSDTINTSRESRGLKPLDWCTELIKYDKGWHKKKVVYKTTHLNNIYK